MQNTSFATEQLRCPAATAEVGNSTPGNTIQQGCPASAAGAYGQLQATHGALAVFSSGKEHAQAAVGVAGALVTPFPISAEGSVSYMQTPIGNQLKLPDALLQGLTTEYSATTLAVFPSEQQAVMDSTRLAPAGAAAAFSHPQPPTGQTRQPLPPLLLQQTNTAPLMQQVLQKQRTWQDGPQAASKQQANSSTLSNGKRKGYCVEPDALRRMVERQLQLQREKQQKEQIRQKMEQRLLELRQQLQQWQEVAQQDQQQVLQQQQHRQSQQQHQQSQRLRQSHLHQQRSMPRVTQELRQQLQQLQAATTALPGGATAAADAWPATGAAVDQSGQLQSPLQSPDARIARSPPIEPAAGLSIEGSKLFGSAQKRLRLSICDELHHGSLVSSVAAADLAQAFVSPVLLPGTSGAWQHPVTPAANKAAVGHTAGAAALSVAVLEAEAPTPSKYFAPSPGAVISESAATTGVLNGVTAATTQSMFPASTKAQASRSADTGDDTIAAAAAAAVNSDRPPVAGHPPAQATITPSKAGAESPSIEDSGKPLAATDAATDDAVAGRVPPFITPSKFFNCSPASADRQAGDPMHKTPITPLLFNLPASPWSRQGETQQQQQQQQGLMTTSNPLRTARRSSTSTAAQPSSWVPVAEHSQFVQLLQAPDSAAVTATPASGQVRIGLFSTPVTAGDKRQSARDAVVDPVAAAAAPVDIEAIRRRTSSTAARDPSLPAAPSSSVPEHAVCPAAVPALTANGELGLVTLMTPAGQEQQVTATPLTELV